jgi:hypothetical protein
LRYQNYRCRSFGRNHYPAALVFVARGQRCGRSTKSMRVLKEVDYPGAMAPGNRARACETACAKRDNWVKPNWHLTEPKAQRQCMSLRGGERAERKRQAICAGNGRNTTAMCYQIQAALACSRLCSMVDRLRSRPRCLNRSSIALPAQSSKLIGQAAGRLIPT